MDRCFGREGAVSDFYEKRIPGTTIIYSLIDPITREIRYVGKTVQGLKRRLATHIDEAARFGNRWVQRWVNVLVNGGSKPVIKMLERVSNEEWVSAECKWIKAMWDYGCPLTNLTKGGDGVVGYIPTQETRDRISKANLGRVFSQETRKKISEALKGKKHTQEAKNKMSKAKKGRPLPPDQAAVFSEFRKNRYKDPEEVKKTSEAMKESWRRRQERGPVRISPMKEEHKNKIGEAIRRGWESEEIRSKRMAGLARKEVKDKMRKSQIERWSKQMSSEEKANRDKAAASRRGIPRSEETKQKIRDKLSGRKMTEDQIAKMRAHVFTDEHKKRLSDSRKRSYAEKRLQEGKTREVLQ